MGRSNNVSQEIESLRSDREALRKELAERLVKVNKNARRYRRLNTAMLVISLLFGLLAATLAGDSAVGGKTIAGPVAEATTGKTPSELPKGWRNVCGLIALFTLIGTAATGVNNVLKIAEHRAKAFVCAGVLDGLRTNLLIDSRVQQKTIEKAKADLSTLLREYPEYFR
ncbi:MAG: hypothetical protein M3461_07580 [Pseudomonadota bacterium]|nr:hypothetical protein [Pseudomonadota bacterium]